MNLIEAIKIGSEGKRIARGTFYRFSPKGKVVCACPLGMAAIACGLNPDPDWDWQEQQRRVKNQLLDCGLWPNPSLRENIYSVNDQKKFSLDETLIFIEQWEKYNV